MSQGTYISMGGTGNSQIGAMNFRGITSTSNVVVYGQIVNQVTNYSNGNISGRLDIIIPSNSRGNITYMSCVNGNVGLNNSNPQYGVDISGTFNVKNNGVNALTINNGNVGMNITNPLYDLDISGTFNVKNNGVNALVVVNGNVGLNNSNPQYTLDVSGIISTPSGIFITGTTNSPSIAFSNGGATGIGYVGFNGAYSSSANTGDLVIRSDVNKNLFLQSGTGGSAITIDSSNAVSVSLNFIGSDNVFNATAISNPLVKNGLARGTADGATLSSFNTAINSWYGTGFVDTCFKKCNCVINNRTGDITTNGAFGFSYTTMPTLLSNQIGYIYYEQNSSWTPAGTGFQRLTNINLSIGVWQVHANINFGNSPLAGLLLETYNAYTSTPGVTGAVTFFSASHDPGTGTGILASTNSRNTTGQPANMCASSVICVTTTGSGGNSNLAVVYYCETTAASKYTIRAVRIA